MKHEKIVAKGVYRFEMELDTPISIGASSSFDTDHDLVKRDCGDKVEYFIPATSIAGPIRVFSEKYLKNDRYNCFFSAMTNENSTASPFTITDGEFDKIEGERVFSRDGIAIDGFNKDKTIFEKTTSKGAKYDYQIIQKGSTFTFVIEYTLREGYKKCFNFISDNLEENLKNIEQQLFTIAAALTNHTICLGYKKNRGFGCCKVNKLFGKYFYGNTLKDYVGLDYKSLPIINKSKYEDIKTNQDIVISCSVKLLSAISIKSYSDNSKDNFDFSQLIYNDEAAIPGSSLMGALHHQMEKILKELNINDLNITDLLGDGEKHESNIKVEETYLKNGKPLITTRTAIDRFTGAGLNSSLFTQKVYVKGDGTLSFVIKNEEKLTPYIGLFLLALNDLIKGYCPVGGSTSIGYGILQSNEIKANGNVIDINNNEYVDALAKLN